MAPYREAGLLHPPMRLLRLAVMEYQQFRSQLTKQPTEPNPAQLEAVLQRADRMVVMLSELLDVLGLQQGEPQGTGGR
jgi:hypothetical protein